MSKQLTNSITVFIASPGDINDERDAAESAAREVGSDVAFPRGVAVEVRRWEQVIGRAGNPQAQINPDIEDADMFIGVIYRRWGTETGNGYDSGFQEEFELALERWKRTGEPEIHLYFKAIEPAQQLDPGPQLAKVIAFRERIEREHAAFFTIFADAHELKHQVYRAVNQYLSQRAAPTAPTHSETSSPDVEAKAEQTSEGGLAAAAISQTLSQFTKLAEGKGFDGPLDVDRLELFAISIGRDEETLSTHLANRLYLRRDQLILIQSEADTWFRTFLVDVGQAANLSERTVPFLATTPTHQDLCALVSQQARASLASQDARIVRGWLRLATRFGLRPVELWSTPTGADSDRSRLEDLWKIAPDVTVKEDVILYWMQVSRTSDVERARVLAQSTDHDLSAVGKLLVDLLQQKPDATALAAVIPSVLCNPIVQRVFPNHDPFATLTSERLGTLCESTHLDIDIRTRSLAELIRRQSLPAKVLRSTLTLGLSDRFAHDSWGVRAAKMLFDRSLDETTLDAIASAAASLPASARHDAAIQLARTEYANPSFSERRRNLDGSPDWSPEGVAVRLTLERDRANARKLATSILENSNRSVQTWIDSLRLAGATDGTVVFVREQYELAALSVLVEDSARKTSPEVSARVRSIAANGELTLAAGDLLVKVFRDADLEAFVSNSRLWYRADALRLAAHVASRLTLQGLQKALRTDNAYLAVASIEELDRRKHPLSRKRLVDLLYDTRPTVRVAAAMSLISGRSLGEAEALAASYAHDRTSYYYNVICVFDEHLSDYRRQSHAVSSAPQASSGVN